MRAYAWQVAGIAVYFFTIISDRPTKCQIDSMDLRLNSLLHVNNFESSLELVVFFKESLESCIRVTSPFLQFLLYCRVPVRVRSIK